MCCYRDLETAMTFFAEDCYYEDMIYKKPFVVRTRRSRIRCGTAALVSPVAATFTPAARGPPLKNGIGRTHVCRRALTPSARSLAASSRKSRPTSRSWRAAPHKLKASRFTAARLPFASLIT